MLVRALKATAVSILILAGVGLVVLAHPSMASGKPNFLALVRGISIHETPGGAAIIDIAVSKRVPYRTLHLTGPERLVVDLKGARKAVHKGVYAAESPLLERVRVGQFQSNPAIVRVVADLRGAPASSIHASASGIRIELKPRVTERLPTDGSRADHSQPARNDSENRARTDTQGPAPKTVFPVHRFKDLSASLTGPELPPQDRLVPVTQPDPSISGGKKSPMLALVSEISIKPDHHGETYIDIASSRAVPYRVFQLTNPFRLVVDLKNARDASRRRVYPVESSVLKRVRVDQWRSEDPAVVRVVADLEGYPVFDVHAERPGLRIELRPRQKLVPLIRNPFEFATQRHNMQPEFPATQSNQAVTAATSSTAPTLDSSLSNLKVIGYVKKRDSATQAVISDRTNIYFVSKGGTFENRFRVIAISPNAVQIQNVETLETSWFEYAP